MTRFNAKIGAAVLLGLAALYLVLSLATGRSAASEKPADLTPAEAALDVWRTAALLVREQGKVSVVDVRTADRFGMFHLPGAVNFPGGNASDVVAASKAAEYVLLVAEQDKDASVLAAQVVAAGKPKTHYLKDGARSWYLAFELPLPLFNDKPPPHGWREAQDTTRGWFAGTGRDQAAAIAAIGALSKMGYEPSMLGSRKPAAAAGGKKKISGGCGG